MNRLSFSKSDAIHLYEYLRFYWKTDYESEFWTPDIMKECGKFGCCPQCENIGKRLENFIGKKEVRYVDKLIKENCENKKSPKF
jgi:hypothetical protein